jgi:hypothetical protein
VNEVLRRIFIDKTEEVKWDGENCNDEFHNLCPSPKRGREGERGVTCSTHGKWGYEKSIKCLLGKNEGKN